MKTQTAVGLLLLSSVLGAAETAVPSFPEAKIELPPLTLGDAAKAGIPSPFGEPGRMTAAVASASAHAPRKVSRMPVLRPKYGDSAMVVTPPDEGVDYKMKVKRPDVAQAE